MHASSQIFPSFGEERAGISLVTALRIGVGARATAMGESFVALADDPTTLYWNPAGAVNQKSAGASFTHTMWIGGLAHSAGNAIYSLSEDHAVGLSFSSLNLGSIPVTTELQPTGTGELFRFGSMQVGATYARRFTDQFSAGVTLRYVHEVHGRASLQGVLFDAGTYYRTGLGTSRFAVAISNFGGKLRPEGTVTSIGTAPNFNGGSISTFQSFDPPINFRFGFAMEPIMEENYWLTLAFQLNHPNDNAENYAFGAEFTQKFTEAFPAQLSLRSGYKLNVDNESFSAGAGLFLPIAAGLGTDLDYSYAHLIDLGGVHRLGMGIRF